MALPMYFDQNPKGHTASEKMRYPPDGPGELAYQGRIDGVRSKT